LYLAYSFILALGLLVSSPYWMVKGIRERKYLNNFLQRLGFRMPPSIGSIHPLWIHAVSVGEVLAVKPLLLALHAVRPEMPIVISTVTLTGMALARKELSSAKSIFFFPFDWGFCVNRFLRLLRPRAVVLMETELWPNFLNKCSQSSIPVFLANGRISDTSWGRYRWLRWITQSMLAKIQTIGAQTQTDKERLVQLGARRNGVLVTGNLKFDFPDIPLDKESEVLRNIGNTLRLEPETPVIVVGSSMKGEDALFLDVFAKVRQAVPSTRLVIAPRHPERFDEVAHIIRDSGIPAARRSNPDTAHDGAAIFLLDSIGELRTAYSLATVVVIGGSFRSSGGHNPLEPAALGKAILFGPDMSNFREIARVLIREQAALQCTQDRLAQVLIELLQDDRARERLGQRAMAALKANRGAAEKSAQFLLDHIG